MKYLPLAAMVVLVLICMAAALLWMRRKPVSPTGNGRVEWVETKTLVEGPIQHETLSDEQLKRVSAIHATFAEVDGLTLEKRIDGFKRDMHIDRELEIWELMGRAYTHFVQSRSLSLEAKKEVLQVVLLRSMAPEEEVLTHLKLEVLSKDDAVAVMRGQ